MPGPAFEPGLLYVRLENNAVSLFYTKERVYWNYSTFCCRKIAEMERGHGVPSESIVREGVHDFQRSSFGHVVHFRQATDEDITKIFRAWSIYGTTLSDWVKNLETLAPTLSRAEKQRLVRLAKNCSH